MTKPIKARIEAAASDMSIEHDGVNSPGDTLLMFLREHDLTITERPKRDAPVEHICAERLSDAERDGLMNAPGGWSQHVIDLCDAMADTQDKLVEMLRNMVAAPTFWRSKAKALLLASTTDAPGDPSPTVPPEPES